MADRPIFLYAAIYDDIADAEADYDAVFDLHAMGAIDGSTSPSSARTTTGRSG